MPNVFTLLFMLLSLNGILSKTTIEESSVDALWSLRSPEKFQKPDDKKVISGHDESALKISLNGQSSKSKGKPDEAARGDLLIETITIRTEERVSDFTNRHSSPSAGASSEISRNSFHKMLTGGNNSDPIGTKNPIEYAFGLAEKAIDSEVNKSLSDEIFDSKSSYSNGTALIAENSPPKPNEPEKVQAVDVENESATATDPVDEEIKQVLDSLPKLPETASAGNNTPFVFHKDPEEAVIDERITQVARQLAETGLRREYEEKKLGHFLPIRLRQFDEQFSDRQFPPARQFATVKSMKSPLDILLELARPLHENFKPLSLPEHIYSGPFFIPKELQLPPSQLSTEAQEMSQSNPVFVTGTDANENPESHLKTSSLAELATILQLGPRYVMPTARNLIGQNRAPVIFSLTPREYTSYNNQNDLNGYPYSDLAE